MAEREQDESDAEDGIKVTDRRLFTADGQLRSEIAEGFWQAMVLASLRHYAIGFALGSFLGVALGVAVNVAL